MTSKEWERRVCWLVLTCLALPAWHDARTKRLPELVGQLASRTRKGEPN